MDLFTWMRNELEAFAQIVYDEMQQFAEQFIRDLRAGLEEV